jgi:hypothetical protein
MNCNPHLKYIEIVPHSDKRDCVHRTLIYTTPDGQIFKYRYFPWVGYFERLGEVYIEETIIESQE